mgnify:FL=1
MEKIKFRDRISKYPNRKKLKIISQNENEIVAEVTPADEAQVEGVELNAKILNKWQDVISTSEDNAMLAKNKVHIAEDNAKLAVKYSKEAISKAEQAEMVAEFVSKSVNNTFIPIKTSELYNDNQFISAKEQNLTDEEKLQARENIGAGTSNFSGDYEDLINKPYIPSYDNVPTKDYINEKISNLVNSAPETLDTLGEIASALEENEDVISALNSVVSNKVDKVAGKGLSTNDFTNEDKTNLEENSLARHGHTNKSILDSTTASFTTQEKTKLYSIEEGAEVNNPIDSTLSTTSENAVQNKVITEALNNKTTVNISNVAQDSINFTSDPQTQLNEKLDTTELLNKIYPIGSIYISVNQTSPASFIGGTWQALDEGRTLWTTTTAGQGGTTVSAGLPNIEGSLESVVMAKTYDNQPYSTGALSFGNNVVSISGAGNGWWTYLKPLYFNANDDNDIYGNSTTVQPPAFIVYMWKRTA